MIPPLSTQRAEKCFLFRAVGLTCDIFFYFHIRYLLRRLNRRKGRIRGKRKFFFSYLMMNSELFEHRVTDFFFHVGYKELYSKGSCFRNCIERGHILKKKCRK